MKSPIPVQIIFREYFEGLVAAIGLAVFIRVFIISVLFLPEEHMGPGLQKGDFVVGWKVSYGLKVPFSEDWRLNAKVPERGDVVSFRFPGDEDQVLVRRIVGLPGETIEIKGGVVTIDGRSAGYSDTGEGLQKEMWPESSFRIQPNPALNFGPAKIPMGEYFVLTDDRNAGDHSGRWGFLPMKNIQSRLGFIWLSVNTKDSGFQLRWDRMFRFVKSSN